LKPCWGRTARTRTLDDGLGRDTLAGGRGQDLLTGGEAEDAFTGAGTLGAVDTITDLQLNLDEARLSAATFRKVGPLGALSAERFALGTATDGATGSSMTRPPAPSPMMPMAKGPGRRCSLPSWQQVWP
jgi:hypothetical protein